MKRTAHCLCAAVCLEIETEAEPEVGACHCGMCQRWAGSAAMMVTVRPGGLTVADEGAVARFASSDWAERAFCRICGSNLWYEVTMDGPLKGTRYVSVGLFEDKTGLTLGMEIFHDRKMPVFDYAGETKKLTEAETFAMVSGG